MTTTKVNSYSLTNVKTYTLALLFITGNLLLPQLAHLVPNGGPALLPIYFFTLIAAYKFGIKTGLLTAILSPLLNSLIFGMPVLGLLPIIIIKSALLAFAAAYAANYFQKVTILSLVIVVLAYQIAGTLIEWLFVQNFWTAVQDFRIGLLGMAIQVIGGYAVLKGMEAFRHKKSN